MLHSDIKYNLRNKLAHFGAKEGDDISVLANKNIYSAQLVGGKYNINEVLEFCQTRFDDTWIWAAQISEDETIILRGKFYFEFEEQAIIFKLKFPSI